jgi:hypothetical protein
MLRCLARSVKTRRVHLSLSKCHYLQKGQRDTNRSVSRCSHVIYVNRMPRHYKGLRCGVQREFYCCLLYNQIINITLKSYMDFVSIYRIIPVLSFNW